MGPIVKLFGEPTTTVEAGFPYEDLAATATDTLDGDVTSKIVNAGGPGVAHFNYETSCKAIKSISPSAANGNYNVLVTIGGHHQFLPVYCDMSTQSTFFIHKGHKLFHDDIKESEMIVPYATHQGACGTYGLKMASFSSATAENNAVLYARTSKPAVAPTASSVPPRSTASGSSPKPRRPPPTSACLRPTRPVVPRSTPPPRRLPSRSLPLSPSLPRRASSS